ncbi:glycosyltransferase family 9 protein [Spirosoma taeanense]|uniref:Glycosyltransferase family 9 protein n=1 Tax=Spirosoma taeanense TaxID=2735870 RepID=A0A6M5Y9P1_9BACT|nr:glycosyltransferase family 9 protein [Spirosoma taeanense]QJW90689.1 glycosyltransferase family 9 protein [Spirosoma taeanense]
MTSPAKILVLRFSSIGDIVLTTPVVRCLKQQLPNAEVHFCTKRAFQAIVEHNPYIDKCHYLDDSLWTLLRQLRAERYDYIIDLHHNLRTSLIKTGLVGVRSYSFDKLNLRKWFYVRWKVNVMPNQHIVDRYMAAVRPLGVENDEQGLDYFIPYKDQIETDWLPATHRQDYVAFAIGGQHATKKLPVPRLIELCRKINHPIVLLGGKEDRAAGEAIVEVLGEHLIYNACGQYNLNQSASLLQRARIVFSHDTGLMHIASALKKKVYSIWGNTTPQLGMYPYKTAYVVLEKTGLDCRPCSKIGFEECPLKHFKCMNELPFDFEVKELRKKKNFE